MKTIEDINATNVRSVYMLNNNIAAVELKNGVAHAVDVELILKDWLRLRQAEREQDQTKRVKPASPPTHIDEQQVQYAPSEIQESVKKLIGVEYALLSYSGFLADYQADYERAATISSLGARACALRKELVAHTLAKETP